MSVLGGDAKTPDGDRRRRRVRPARRSAIRSYYAIAASEGEIAIPAPAPLGYYEQSKLIRAAQAGDLDAWRRVWAQHARLAFTIVNRYRVRPDQVADAVQEAQIGLARAIQKFEIDRLHEFSTYAFHWLRQGILRFRHYNTLRFRLPDYLFYAYMDFSRQVAGAPTRSEWFDARDAWLTRDHRLYHRMVRVYAAANPELLSRDCPRVDEQPSPFEALIAAERHAVIWECLMELEPREREVLCRRHGLDDQPEETLVEIGDRLRLTRERIRQIQVKAEAKLRDALVDRNYEDPPRPEQLAVADRLSGLDLQVPASSAPPILVQPPPPPITIRPHEFSAREPLLFEP